MNAAVDLTPKADGVEFSHWSKFPMAQWRWPNFSPEEIACKGTGKLKVDFASMDMLQGFREQVGKPFLLNSAYRSVEHNKNVGGAKSSQHLKGKAFDIRMTNHDPNGFKKAAQAFGWGGIGTYPQSKFIHLDTGGAGRRWGDPFPKTAPTFDPEEAPIPVVKEPAVAAAGAAGGVSAVLALVNEYYTQLAAIIPLGYETEVLVGVVAAAVAVVVWRWWQGRAGVEANEL